jgi:hypothetical protein
MSFGFDPSIILAASKASEGTFGDTLQQLASIKAQQAQQQHAQATLGELLRKQQQEQTLADIFRSNAADPAARVKALYAGGFGAQALREQDQLADLRDGHFKHVGGLFSGVDTPEKYAAARKLLETNPDPMLAVYASHLPEQYDPAIAERLGALSPRTVKLPLSEEERDARVARAELERAKAEALRRGKPADPDKQEAIRLKNEEKRRKLSGGGGPNKLTAIEGYDQDPEFAVTPATAEKLRGAQADTRAMANSVDELMALYHQYGNKVLPGAVRARMGSLATNLQLTAKGPNMYGLGVIAGPDMDLLNAVISNPTKKDATIADFFSGGGDAAESMERLRVFREQLGSKIHTALSTRGFRKKKDGAKAAGSLPKSLDAAENASWSDADEARLQELERAAGGGT